MRTEGVRAEGGRAGVHAWEPRERVSPRGCRKSGPPLRREPGSRAGFELCTNAPVQSRKDRPALDEPQAQGSLLLGTPKQRLTCCCFMGRVQNRATPPQKKKTRISPGLPEASFYLEQR